MKKLLSIVLLSLSPFLVFGQELPVNVAVTDLPRRLQAGDMYYPSSFSGIKSLMADIQMENPELHAVLLPDFSTIEKKRRQALTYYLLGAGTGTFFVVGGLTFLQKKETIESIFSPGDKFYEPPKTEKSPSIGAISAGMGLYLIGGIIGYLISPDEGDIYRFVNRYNKHSPDKKLRWDIGFDANRACPMGLKLTMSF
ncbi:MAG: hypothetical protein MI784_16365 [Cytophagales bacterium]|nr:hypothetical protein [Cytophagales bacterium]